MSALQNIYNVSWEERRRERTRENLVWSRGMVWWCVSSSFWAWVSKTEEGPELQKTEITLKQHDFSEIELGVPFLGLGAIFWCVVDYS